MSLFGSIMGDFDDDPFFGSHMRHMRQMNNMMNSMNSMMFADPFSMLGGMGGMGGMAGMAGMGGPLAITGAHHHHPRAMMPFMPQMPQMNMNRLLTGGLNGDMQLGGHCNFSSSTVVMSNGPDGRPQVISSSSSTQLGPDGVKETRRTMQDSRTGTKKMAIGHHIGERAHVIEREQNLHSGDQEETQEFINIEEEEAEDFNREFEQRSTFGSRSNRQQNRAIMPLATGASGSRSPQLALPAPDVSPRHSVGKVPSARRPLRQTSNPLTLSSSPSTNPNSSSVARQTYSTLQPQRKHHSKHPKKRHDNTEH